MMAKKKALAKRRSKKIAKKASVTGKKRLKKAKKTKK